LSTAPLDPDSIVQGETFARRLTLFEEGTAKDLTGATALWLLTNDLATVGPYEIGSGIEFEGNPLSGVLVVTVPSAVTEDLLGYFTQEWMVTDVYGDVRKWMGEVRVIEAEIAAADG